MDVICLDTHVAMYSDPLLSSLNLIREKLKSSCGVDLGIEKLRKGFDLFSGICLSSLDNMAEHC